MKIYLRTETIDATSNTADPRPPVLVRETAASADQVRAALEASKGLLGAVIAIPPAAHESNLKHVVARDLEANGVAAGASEGGRATLVVRRTALNATTPQAAETFSLSYDVLIEA